MAFDHAFLPFAFDDDVTSRVYLQEIFKSLQNNLIVALPLLQRNESGILKYLELIFKDKINSYRQQAKYNIHGLIRYLRNVKLQLYSIIYNYNFNIIINSK